MRKNNVGFKVVNQRGEEILDINYYLVEEETSEEIITKIESLFNKTAISYTFNLKEGKTLGELDEALKTDTLEKVCESIIAVVNED